MFSRGERPVKVWCVGSTMLVRNECTHAHCSEGRIGKGPHLLLAAAEAGGCVGAGNLEYSPQQTGRS